MRLGSDRRGEAESSPPARWLGRPHNVPTLTSQLEGHLGVQQNDAALKGCADLRSAERRLGATINDIFEQAEVNQAHPNFRRDDCPG